MNKLIVIILLFSIQLLHAQKFIGHDGKILFFSEAPMEDISAVNDKVSAVFDASTTDLVFQLKISDFIFPKALMQEHFNENYLESDVYPKSTFLGKVVHNENGKATVDGDLTIHGKTNKIRVDGVLFQNKKSVIISADFGIKLED
ncbi:MAG: YceI family protein, partial [Bacteroidota bacterium]|nr:YceI family protein [Bacteroidota bacterium]